MLFPVESVLYLLPGMVLTVLVGGATIGAIVWRMKRGALWGLLAVFLLADFAAPIADVRIDSLMAISGPGGILTLLSALLGGRFARARGKRDLSATAAALLCGLIVGAVYMILFRVLMSATLWTPVWIAVAADVTLLWFVIWGRRRQSGLLERTSR